MNYPGFPVCATLGREHRGALRAYEQSVGGGTEQDKPAAGDQWTRVERRRR